MTNNHTEPMKVGDECREAFNKWLSDHYVYFGDEITSEEHRLMFNAWQAAWNRRAEPSPAEVGSEGPTVEVLTEFINRIRVKHAAKESIEQELRQATNYLYGPRVSEAEIRAVEEMSQALSQQSPARVEGEESAIVEKPSIVEFLEDLAGHAPKEIGGYLHNPTTLHCFAATAKALLPDARALNQRLTVKEGEAVVRRFIECRSSVAFDLRNYGQLILRKGESVNQCDHDEANRLQSLLDFIDELIDAPLSTHPVSDDQQAKDAARYRWLRDQKEGIEFRDAKGIWRADCPNGDELDMLIDAALNQHRRGKYEGTV